MCVCVEASNSTTSVTQQNLACPKTDVQKYMHRNDESAIFMDVSMLLWAANWPAKVDMSVVCISSLSKEKQVSP